MLLRRSKMYRMLGTLFLAITIAGSSGCAALLIGGALAGGAAAGYAYYQGNHPYDHPYPQDVTLNATNGALNDLEMPIITRKTSGRNVELETRNAKGEKILVLVEPGTNAQMPSTRVHVRVGVFGDEVTSNRIHAQIASRLQNNVPANVVVPTAETNTPATQPNNVIPPIQIQPTGTNQTTAPPIAEQQGVVPVSNSTSPTPAPAAPE